LLAVILYRPVYAKMYELANLQDKTEVADLKTIQRKRSTSEAGDSVLTVKATRHFSDSTRLVETTVRTVPKVAGSETRIETRKEVLLHGGAYYSMIGLVLIQLILVTMVYGPIAAFLVELFPTRIRYTSMSLPYHIGNGVFGGLTPFIATSLYEYSKTPAQPAGDPFAGLFYPITIAGLTFITGMIFLRNRRPQDLID